MIERFQELGGQAAVLNELRRQFLIDGNSSIAKILASATQVREFAPDAVLFTEGDRGGD